MSKRNRQSKRRVKSLMSLLFLTAILLIASTYAWFSANRTVTINTITAHVVAAEGLQISLDGEKWSASLDLTQANLEAALAKDAAGVEGSTFTALTVSDGKYSDTHNASPNLSYCIPTDLIPVSASGTITSKGGLQMITGLMTNEGTQIEVSGTAENDTSKYICFDMFLKNSSTQDADVLQLKGTDTKVLINTNGTAETGLEYSTRIGFVFFGETAPLVSNGTTIRALTPTKDTSNPVAAIWEPYNATGTEAQHIGEVVNNDRRITLATDSFVTYALNGQSIGKNVYQIDTPNGNYYTATNLVNGGAETVDVTTDTANAYLTAPATVATAGTVAADTDLFSVAGSSSTITLPGNSITKVRVYIWLEGQDPDCNDTASTGDLVDFYISLTKPEIKNETP